MSRSNIRTLTILGILTGLLISVGIYLAFQNRIWLNHPPVPGSGHWLAEYPFVKPNLTQP